MLQTTEGVLANEGTNVSPAKLLPSWSLLCNGGESDPWIIKYIFNIVSGCCECYEKQVKQIEDRESYKE